MALTYEQLSGFLASSDLAGQIQGAVADVAADIQAEAVETPNHANRVQWAAKAFASPSSVATEMRAPVFTAFADTLSPQSPTLTDAQIKTAVADAVNTFADGQ